MNQVGLNRLVLLVDVQFAEGSFDSEHFLGCFGSSGSFLFIGFHLLAFHEPLAVVFGLLFPESCSFQRITDKGKFNRHGKSVK